MSINISLDPEQESKQSTTQPPETAITARTPDEIVEMLLTNPGLATALTRQDRAQEINFELMNEVNAVLQEADGRYFDETTKGVRYFDWETRDVPYRVLKRAAQTEPARLIINKRRLDLAPYGMIPKEDGIQRGFVLKFRNKNYSPSKEEKITLDIWAQKFVDTFFYAPNDDVPSLPKFIGACYEDWFTYDDMTMEIRRDGYGCPLALHLQDPVIYKPTIKKRSLNHIKSDEMEALSAMLGDYSEMQLGENVFAEEKDNYPDYIGIYNNIEFAQLTRDQLFKSHFFVQSDFRKAKRGYSVVEQGLNLIAYLVSSLTMNASNFQRNKVPDGLLVFQGIGQFQLTKIQKVLSAYINGTNNNNRLPMVDITQEKASGKPAEYIHFRPNSRDMEYHLWWSLLFSAWCQFSGTDPNEASMASHKDAIGKKGLFEDSPDGMIKESKDAGAKTFLAHLADTLNTPAPTYKKNIFQHITGLDIICDFIGLQIEDKKFKQEIYEKELKTTSSINELLAREDKEKFELKISLGDNQEVNLFDIPALGHETVKAVIQGKMNAANQEKIAAQQASGATASPTPGAEPAPDEQQINENELTTSDKDLLTEYGKQKGVRIDEKVKAMLEAAQEEDNNE